MSASPTNERVSQGEPRTCSAHAPDRGRACYLVFPTWMSEEFADLLEHESDLVSRYATARLPGAEAPTQRIISDTEHGTLPKTRYPDRAPCVGRTHAA